MYFFVFTHTRNVSLLTSLFIFALKASPDMAVTLLEIARIFATKVPGKVDADVLQLLWKVSFLFFSLDKVHEDIVKNEK